MKLPKSKQHVAEWTSESGEHHSMPFGEDRGSRSPVEGRSASRRSFFMFHIKGNSRSRSRGGHGFVSSGRSRSRGDYAEFKPQNRFIQLRDHLLEMGGVLKDGMFCSCPIGTCPNRQNNRHSRLRLRSRSRPGFYSSKEYSNDRSRSRSPIAAAGRSSRQHSHSHGGLGQRGSGKHPAIRAPSPKLYKPLLSTGGGGEVDKEIPVGNQLFEYSTSPTKSFGNDRRSRARLPPFSSGQNNYLSMREQLNQLQMGVPKQKVIEYTLSYVTSANDGEFIPVNPQAESSTPKKSHIQHIQHPKKPKANLEEGEITEPEEDDGEGEPEAMEVDEDGKDTQGHETASVHSSGDTPVEVTQAAEAQPEPAEAEIGNQPKDADKGFEDLFAAEGMETEELDYDEDELLEDDTVDEHESTDSSTNENGLSQSYNKMSIAELEGVLGECPFRGSRKLSD